MGSIKWSSLFIGVLAAVVVMWFLNRKKATA
jgi:hypothetical protein